MADVPYCLHSNDLTKEFVFPVTGAKESDLRFEIHPVEKLSDRTDVLYEEARRVYVGTGDNAGTYFSRKNV